MYVDPNGYYHGFVRAADGAIIGFDPPGSNTESFRSALSINRARTIVGFYTPAIGCSQDFVRDANGVIRSVVVPGAECRDLDWPQAQ
jgi:hypothetical protein